MSDTPEILTRPARPIVLLLLALCAAFPGGVPAQEPTPATEAASAAPEAASPEAAALRRQIEERYEVLPVRGGLVLQPREDFRGVRTIEITGAELAVNGRSVGREELRAWMGERAAAVLRLADLDPEERLGLFDAEEPADDADEDQNALTAEDEDGASAVVVAPEVPEPPEPPEVAGRRVHRGPQTVVGSSVRIAQDEVSEDVVVFGGSADIEGRVEGDVVVFGGPVDVEGEVTRDVTAIGGNVYLGEDSEVGGEVTAVGGRVRRDAGARVRGGINEARGVHGPFWGGWDWGRWDGPMFSPVGWLASMIWPVAELLFLALLVIFLLAIARPTVERVGTRAGAEPLKSGIVGLLVAVLIFPAFLIVSVLLALSIIGIPILLVLILLFVFAGIPALLIAALVGYSGVAWRLGRWSEGRFGWRLESAFMAAVVGLFLLHVLDLVGHALDFGPLRVFGVMFLIAAAVVQFVAWCVGFGAVVLELYDRRQRRRTALAAGAPGAIPPGSPPATPPPAPPAVTPPPPPPATPPPSAPPPERGTE